MSVNSADAVYVWNLTNQNWDIYYHDGTTWRKSGSGLDQSGTIIPAGSGIFTSRQSTATGTNSTLTQLLPYTLALGDLPPLLDGNSDGLGDVWADVFSVPTNDSTADYDAAGFTNKQKSILGLDPRNAGSRFQVQGILNTAQNQLLVRIDTIFGKRYQVESSSDTVSWISEGSLVTGTGGQIDVATTLPDSSVSKRFYRCRYDSDIDADGDGLTAWDEQQIGTVDQAGYSDTDGDGISDKWEYTHGLNPLVNDALLDPDGDGITNLDESQLDTDPFTDSTVVGVSQGKLSAQPSGGSAYEMPIVVSPGTAGMQPKLGFQYSSGGRNGAMGMGWAIGGLSAISRAPQTLAQDNTIRGVDMTINDRYAMDGFYRNPPQQILSEQGLRLHRLSCLSGAIFLGCVALSFFLSWIN